MHPCNQLHESEHDHDHHDGRDHHGRDGGDDHPLPRQAFSVYAPE